MATGDLPFEYVGPYRLLCELGKGGMAVVYLARRENDDSLWAIKMIHGHLSDDPEFAELLMHEARIATRIRHPNVISAEDMGVHDRRMYLRMAYVSGETLFQALSRTWNADKPFPFEVAARVFADAAAGLHAAHELEGERGEPLSVVHRDAGPHNVMIGYDGVSRVMDFGIAKALDRRIYTQAGVLRGTVAFMSPEQVRGEELDRRADIFGLGVALWETTVGARLFKHPTLPGTMARILELEVPKPSTMREDYPPELERVVMRCLERDVAKRMPTARELERELLDAVPKAVGSAGKANVGRFMGGTFSERLAQRLEVEGEARDTKRAGRLTSVLEPHHETELRTVVALAQSAGLPESDRSDSVHTERTELARPVSTHHAPIAQQRSLSIGLITLGMVAFILGLALTAALMLREKKPASPVGPAMVRLSFQLEPKSASLTVDGRPQSGDLVVPLSPQAYSVAVSAAGYETKKLVVSAEASQEFSVRLEPTPAPKPRTKPRRRGR